MVEAREERSQSQREASVVELQLLGNLGRVCDNLRAHGRDRLANQVEQYSRLSFAGKPLEEIDNVDHLTAGLTAAFKGVPAELRAAVFADYRPAEKRKRPGGGHDAYVPKTEVEFYCQEIEPKILEAIGYEPE